MSQNFILLSGRPGSGKTEILIAYANAYSTTTLFLSEEHSIEGLRNKNLSNEVKVVKMDTFSDIDITNYETLCIDYIDLCNKNFINKSIIPLMDTDIRIITAQQMNRAGDIKNNIFKEYLEVSCYTV